MTLKEGFIQANREIGVAEERIHWAIDQMKCVLPMPNPDEVIPRHLERQLIDTFKEMLLQAKDNWENRPEAMKAKIDKMGREYRNKN